MLRSTPLAIGETYHIYNRGAHKQNIFIDDADYKRFALLLFLTNDLNPIDMRRFANKYKGRSFVEAYTEEEISKSLVDVLAYALMPNHFHIVVRQKTEEGITRFLKKSLTAYSMYFNGKYGHSGVLFQGRFKSKHIDSEPYFRYIFSYVHLNPLSLFEPGWEEGKIQNKEGAKDFIDKYSYSSYIDYSGPYRPESKLLAKNDAPDFLVAHKDFDDLLQFTKDGPL